MAQPDLEASDVLAAIAEFDRLGRDAFLEQHGYRGARTYFLVREGRRYDSTAIVGVAHELRHGNRLPPREFSGGEATMVPPLTRLGFTVQTTRNPPWTWDEIVLACDLVRENDWRWLDDADPRVMALSELLRRLPIHPPEMRGPTFRNPNGVSRKTADIATQHPEYRGTATHGNRYDVAVLHEFLRDPARMAAVAVALRATARFNVVDPVPPELDIDESGVEEGRLLERRHLARERSPKLRRKKTDAARRLTGHAACEACGFDFGRTYGEHGADFIECHHLVPLHASGSTTTALKDLVLCSNCHRMIHRSRPWLTFDQLMELIQGARPGRV